MQLSTRSEDIVIDTLALRSHIGECACCCWSCIKVTNQAPSLAAWNGHASPKHHLLIPGRFLSLVLLFSFCLLLPSCHAAIIPAGPALAGVFADPCTLKVLHGADSDVVWLQRDFGLFLVNMFDTGQVSCFLDICIVIQFRYLVHNLSVLGHAVRTSGRCRCGHGL
jgi:hypothetical protein